MKSHAELFGLAILLAAVQLATGQGTVIVQHSGYNNPTTEGFTLRQDGTQSSIGPIINNGVSAWNTTVSNGNNYMSYTYSLTPQQQAETVGTDWILSFTLQDLLPSAVANDFVHVGGAFNILVGSEANGDPYIGLIRSNPMFVLNGGGAGYHSYKISYDAGTAIASLWIDGNEEIDNFYVSILNQNGIPEIDWGESQGGPSSANWNLVSFQITPEPTVLSLVFLGGGALFFLRRKLSPLRRR